jgi:inhibitor of cysteine peptidase
MLEFHESSQGPRTELAAVVALGEPFEISLPENPTTGFRWQMAAAGEPACILVEDHFTPGRAPGGQGIHCWRFQAAQTGEANIRMLLQRQWVPTAEAARSFALRVRVKP